MSIATVHMITVDCSDPAALGRFYQAVLGGELKVEDDDWAVLRPAGAGPSLGFQTVPGYVPPSWPGTSAQTHLDLHADDPEAAEKAVLALGATLLEARPENRWRVYADPAGHAFCLGF
ncbi:VOC family protein [Streptomyces tsukubensis]|uniref:VOC family protein n=1 Tax=Streptomyces tsukubensis TaxID=83656 RepID=UPI00344BB075